MTYESKPKILYTTTDTSPQSGAFHSLLYMSKEIKKWGFESLLVLPEEDKKNGTSSARAATPDHTLRLPKPRRGQPLNYYLQFAHHNSRSILALAKILRKEQVALVHLNEIFDLYGAVAAKLAQVPCVWHIRAELSAMGMLQPLLPRIVLTLANAVIAVSDSVDEHVFRQQRMHSNKVSVIHNPGPNLQLFHPDIDGAAVREEFGIAPDGHLVVLVAKLGERKGHEILIRAAPQVLASFPNCHFLLVGGELAGTHHQEYCTRVKELPRELGVEEKVTFTGYRHDVPQIMAAADIVTHCSTYPDPFPGVVLQGMAVGRPVIAPDLGGPKEQIEHDVSGILVKPGDPAALAETICTLLANEEKRSSLGKAAASHVRSKFAPELFFQKLSAMYDSLIYPNSGILIRTKTSQGNMP